MKHLFLILALSLALFLSFRLGMAHVINDSAISVSDSTVIIEIDGNLYTHDY